MNNIPKTIDTMTALSGQAVREIGASREVPKGFYERPDGIVAPERLRRPEPTITINGRVDQDMFRQVSSDLGKVEDEGRRLDGLQVNFSSFGGSVTSGFGVHDLLRVFARKHGVPVTITGYGPIMSMGALIIQAGDKRIMPENSRMPQQNCFPHFDYCTVNYKKSHALSQNLFRICFLRKDTRNLI